MNAAQVINGVVVAYPYLLRPFAKQAHPGVSPLPGTWEQCAPDQLSALECVDVQLVARPELQPGESCAEGTPEFVGGQWRQVWVVTAPEPGPPPVPESVPAHHLRRALRAFGMLAGVTTYMAALPEDDEMRESWEYAPYFRRDALGIEAARVALGLSVGQVDVLFRAAGQIIA